MSMSVRHVFLLLAPFLFQFDQQDYTKNGLMHLKREAQVINGGKASSLLHKYSEYKLAVNAIVLYQTAA